MARQRSLPDDLSPTQVIALQDALLTNADSLLQAALTMLENENVPLARSLAILGMEESGKAIALHERRVAMAWAPEGDPFVDVALRSLWDKHGLKLETVHRFLVHEEYWFGEGPSDPDENAQVLGTIEAWTKDHNMLKQRGFYVDVTEAGDPITPQEAADAATVREVVGHVHQIGWQLRLDEHIEGKRRLEKERDVPPASAEEIENMRALLARAASRDDRQIDDAFGERLLASMCEGQRGTLLNNVAYEFDLPEAPSANMGRPGYEAQDRELAILAEEVTRARADDDPTAEA